MAGNKHQEKFIWYSFQIQEISMPIQTRHIIHMSAKHNIHLANVSPSQTSISEQSNLFILSYLFPEITIQIVQKPDLWN